MASFRIRKNINKQLLFGYRHRKMEIEEAGLEQEIEMSGPVFAARLSGDGRNNLARIISAGKRMSRLIEDILKLSLITRMDLNYQKTDLSVMANEIREHLETVHSNRKIEWVIQGDVQVNGDARLIERVLENLLGNAVKYTEAVDHARIEFGRTRHTEDVIFFVRDNGIGFDM